VAVAGFKTEMEKVAKQKKSVTVAVRLLGVKPVASECESSVFMVISVLRMLLTEYEAVERRAV
jgi:hypothetical protein